MSGFSIFRKSLRPVERSNVHDNRPVVAVKCWPGSDGLVARLTSYFESWTTLLLCRSRQLSVSHIPSTPSRFSTFDGGLIKRVGVLRCRSNYFDTVVLIIPAEKLLDLTSEPNLTGLYTAISLGHCRQLMRAELRNKSSPTARQCSSHGSVLEARSKVRTNNWRHGRLVAWPRMLNPTNSKPSGAFYIRDSESSFSSTTPLIGPLSQTTTTGTLSRFVAL